MADPTVDQMTRLRLRLLEKKLDNERDHVDERDETVLSTRSHDDQEDALRRALRRKKGLLRRLREQRMLEDLGRPHTWGGTPGWYRQDSLPPLLPHTQTFQAPPATHPPPAPPLPRVLQQIPQQPTTIIQHLPQQQPLIAQVPPPQGFPSSKPESIKEDMVELMLMQNAQMHQIIMHNMMLKAIPPGALPHPSQTTSTPQHLPHPGQTEKPRGASVHHHHHYSSPAVHLPPIGYPMWSPVMSPTGQGSTFLPTAHHMTGPIALSPLNKAIVDGLYPRIPLGL